MINAATPERSRPNGARRLVQWLWPLLGLSLVSPALAQPKSLKSQILGMTITDVTLLKGDAASKAKTDISNVARGKGYVCQSYETYYSTLQVVTYRPVRKKLLAGGYKETVLSEKLPNAKASSPVLANGFTLRLYQKSTKTILIFMRLPPNIGEGNVIICLAKKK